MVAAGMFLFVYDKSSQSFFARDQEDMTTQQPTPLPPPPLILRASPIGDVLPPIESAEKLLSNSAQAFPDEVVHGVLHKGTKGIIASASKAGKTWLLLDLAISVSSGTTFLNWETTQGRVLFVNFEIQQTFITQRIKTVMAAKKLAQAGSLDVWTLRGHLSDFDDVLEQLIERTKGKNYSLIILDPIYKAMVGRSENAASGVGVLCHNLDQVATQTGAALVYCHHFSKGNQAGKSSLDRMSGSGVFARDADTIITMTPHKEANCHVLELILRNFPPQPAFVVQWQFPLMSERPELEPKDLEDGEEDISQASALEELLLALLEDAPLTTSAWQKEALKLDIPAAAFSRTFKNLKAAGAISQKKADKTWAPKQNSSSQCLQIPHYTPLD